MNNICVTVNSKYMRYLYVMLTSLYENNSDERIKLWIIQRDFTESDKKYIDEISHMYGNETEYIQVDEREYEGISTHPSIGTGHWSLEIYFRLRIPEYIPDSVERILLLDVDLAILGGISDLFNLDFDGRLFAAAPNMCDNCQILDEAKGWYPQDRSNLMHYNTGILLWNLSEIRKRFGRNYLYNLIWEYKFGVPTFEEELFNVVFGENMIMTIPCEKWNYIPLYVDVYKNPNFISYYSNDEIKEKCKIVHYAGRNPWHVGPKNDAYYIWWDYCRKTPFYNEILWDSYVNAEKSLKVNSVTNEYKLRFVDFFINDEGETKLREALKRRSVSKLLIYGAGRNGRCLKKSLEGSDIEVDAFVDRNYTGEFYARPVIKPKDLRDFKSDMVLLSNSNYYDEVVLDVRKYTDIPVLTVEELLEVDFSGRI